MADLHHYHIKIELICCQDASSGQEALNAVMDCLAAAKIVGLLRTCGGDVVAVERQSAERHDRFAVVFDRNRQNLKSWLAGEDRPFIH